MRQVLGLVLSHGLKLIGAGALAGIALSLFSGRALQKLLFGVKPFDAVTYVAVAALLLATALVACYWPGRRAMRTDAAVALRAE